MELADYLERIGYAGPVVPDQACLDAIHRHHLLSISYENLDVQLGRPVDLDIERIFDKIVRRRRGGWCYEMNGLLGWALAEIGFDVMRMTGGVARKARGDEMLGNHLVLGVALDGPQIADVGLGNGLLEPTRLREGIVRQGARTFRLESLGGGLWRFHNSEGVMPPDFDFAYAPADETRLASMCERLQTDPESKFLQNLICMRRRADGTDFMLGRVLIEYAPDGSKARRLVESAEAFEKILCERFELEDPELPALWPAVVERHRALFGEAPVDAIPL
jgi:N-hydroxyarylamine O-acetyltransferase